jgi:uncharacterized protein (DUF1810 family)
MNDPLDLERFVAAQDAGGTYQRALNEIRCSRKSGHWMWFDIYFGGEADLETDRRLPAQQ